jgi:hypothetical protein
VDPVPDPLLLRKSGSVRNRTLTSGSVTRNSDHSTTEAVTKRVQNGLIYGAYYKEKERKKGKAYQLKFCSCRSTLYQYCGVSHI